MRQLLLLLVALPAFAVQSSTVCASGCTYSNLQTAIDAAATYQDGTSCVPYLLILTAGETFTGNFTLGAKTCRQYVRLRSSLIHELPAGVRIAPADATKMAKILGTANSVVSTINTVASSGTGYWAFEGLEVSSPLAMTGGNSQYSLIGLPSDHAGENQYDLTPHHIAIDRSYIHGIVDVSGPGRCIAANLRHLTLANSYISQCAKNGDGDSQAIYGINGLGPFYILNNYIEGSTENILFGQGSLYRASIPWLTARWFFIKGNHITKQDSWKRSEAAGVPTWSPCLPGEKYQNLTGGQWYVCDGGGASWSTTANQFRYVSKNLLEFKEGQNAFVEGNAFSKSWPPDQAGGGFLINQSDYPEMNVRGINVISNKWDAVSSVLANANFGPDSSVFTGDIVMENNLYTNFGTDLYGAAGANAGSNVFFFQMSQYMKNIRLRHNTIVGPTSGGSYLNSTVKFSDALATGNTGPVDISDNAFPLSTYHFSLPGYSGIFGWCAMRAAMVNVGDLRIANNLIIEQGSSYTTGDSPGCPAYVDFPTSNIGGTDYATSFTNAGAGDWTMKAAGPGKNAASDGTDTGVDFTVLNAATATAVSGTANGYLQAGFRSITPAATSLSIYYTAPSATACTLAASTSRAFGSTSGSPSVSQTGRAGTGSVTGLAANTVHWLRLSCGADRLYAEARTL